MPVAPSVTPSNAGDGIVLSLTGAWIIAAGKALEMAATALQSAVGTAHKATIDLAGVDRMDTAGAWVIDRARTELAGAGIEAGYRGARPEHALLLHEAGYHPLEPPKASRVSHALTLLAASARRSTPPAPT